jgi:hypothetical protein
MTRVVEERDRLAKNIPSNRPPSRPMRIHVPTGGVRGFAVDEEYGFA